MGDPPSQVRDSREVVERSPLVFSVILLTSRFHFLMPSTVGHQKCAVAAKIRSRMPADSARPKLSKIAQEMGLRGKGRHHALSAAVGAG
jgi:hypothetical protein